MASRPARPTPTKGRVSPARRTDTRVERAIQSAINSGEIVAVGVLHLVRDTVVTVLAGAQNVGAEIGTAAVAAVRGSIKAAHSMGADLGEVVRESIRGTVTAAESIGGELAGVARSAARGAVKTTGDVGGDVATAARRAVEGSVLAAKELGVDVRTLAQSAAEGAMEAADRLGGAASRGVRATLSGTVAGMRSLVAEAAPSARQAGPQPAARKRGRRGGAAKTAPQPRQEGDRGKSTQSKDGARGRR
jgi:hypothetical protein